MTDLEVRLNTKTTGDAFAGLSRDVAKAKAEFKDLATVARIDPTLKTSVEVNDAELDAAARKVQSLDGEQVRIDTEVEDPDASGAVQSVERQFEAIDLRGATGVMSDQLKGALATGGAIGAVFGTAAATLGDDFMDGVAAGISGRQGTVTDAIRTNLTVDDAADAGRVAGQVFSDGFGDGLSGLRFEVAAVRTELQNFDLGTSELQLNKELRLLADQFGIELPYAVETSQRAIANGLAPTVTDSLEGIFQLASRMPLTFDEGLDALNEYAPTIGGINLEMDDFVNYLVTVNRAGSFENLAQGAEALREFNTRLIETDTLTGVLSELSLSSEAIRDAWSRGDAGLAISAINDALGEMEDQHRANEIAAELFGTAVEDSGDRLATVQTITDGLTGSLDESVRSLDDATAAYEENRSGLQELQRDVTNFGKGAANAYGDYYDAAKGKSAEFFGALLGQTAEGEEAVKSFGDEISKVPEIMSRGSRSLDGFGESTDDLSDGLTDAERAAEELEGALRSLSDWADGSGEAALRRVHAAADELTQEFGENEAAAYTLADGWDLTTEAGRRGSEATSDLRQDIARLTEELIDGSVTAPQYTAAMGDLEGQFREAAAAAGLGAEEVDILARSLFDLPDGVDPQVEVHTQEAQNSIANLNAALDGLDGSTSNTYTTHNITTRRVTVYENRTTTSRQFAHGGVVGGQVAAGEIGTAASGGVRNGMTLVGEYGPELVDLAPGSQVHSNEDTQRMLSSSAGGDITVNVYVAGSLMAERDLEARLADSLRQQTLAQ